MSWSTFKKSPRATKWSVRGRDHLAIVRQLPAFRDKALSLELCRYLDTITECRAAGAAVGRVVRFVVAGHHKSRLASWGLLGAATRPLSEHLDDYRVSLTAKGNTAAYVAKTVGRISRVLAAIRTIYWADVRASDVQRFIAELQTVQGEPMSAATRNYHTRDMRSFARWCVRDGRLSASPIEHLQPVPKAKVQAYGSPVRREFTLEELTRLIGAAECSPTVMGITGTDRAMAYKVAAGTGFRAGEIKSLTPESFDLDTDLPTVTVAAGYSKRRRDDTQPIRADLADTLRQWLIGKPRGVPVLLLPDRTAQMLRVDLAAAGIDHTDGAGRVLDFHSLRHTYISLVVQSGASVKVCQELARHSTPTLTIGRYSHTRLHDLTGALEVLPSDTEPQQLNRLRATGTTHAVPAPFGGADMGQGARKTMDLHAPPVDSSAITSCVGDDLESPENTEKTLVLSGESYRENEWEQQDSNLRPRDYESPARFCKAKRGRRLRRCQIDAQQ